VQHDRSPFEDRPCTREKTAIQVIERMMNLLDTLADRTGAVSLKELSQTTGLHPRQPTGY